MLWFWSSAVLTGNRTLGYVSHPMLSFWSSAVLTGNRTPDALARLLCRFGAVPF